MSIVRRPVLAATVTGHQEWNYNNSKEEIAVCACCIRAIGLVVIQEPPRWIKLFPDQLFDPTAYGSGLTVGVDHPDSFWCGLTGREASRIVNEIRSGESHFHIGAYFVMGLLLSET